MAISTWKAGLDDISSAIRTEKQAYNSAVQRIKDALNNLNNLPTVHSDVVDEINALGTDPSEEVAKDELSKLTTEFTNLKALIQPVADGANIID